MALKNRIFKKVVRNAKDKLCQGLTPTCSLLPLLAKPPNQISEPKAFHLDPTSITLLQPFSIIWPLLTAGTVLWSATSSLPVSSSLYSWGDSYTQVITISLVQ